MMAYRSRIAFLIAVLVLQFQSPLAVLAQDATSGNNQNQLDLSSTNRDVSAVSGQPSFTQATISVGDVSRQVTVGDLLTPAESIALNQVLTSGTQTLILDAAGKAVGGSFSLTNSNLGSLVIPSGVIAISDISTAGALNILGNLTNSGSLFAISTNPQFNTANISANNIFNNQGGLISTVLPSAGVLGLTNALSALSLNLSALQNIINAGAITSSANLSLTAGGSIVNALPVGVTGPLPVMQAVNNLNLFSANIQNAGLIASLQSNINIATQVAQNIVVNNTGGTLSAINGIINVRDQNFSGKFDLSLTGGDIIARELDLFSGNGIISAHVNSLGGQVNIIAGDLSLSAEQGSLRIGALNLSGDPDIRTSGDIFMERSRFGGDWIIPGSAPFILVAGGNIINVDVSTISTSGLPGATGSISLSAGGIIDLQSAPLHLISTASTTGPSGSISIVAGGQVLLGELTLDTHSLSGTSGNIVLRSTGDKIVANDQLTINSSSVTSQAGSVTITGQKGINFADGLSISTGSQGGASGLINITSITGDLLIAGTDIDTTNALGSAANLTISANAGALSLGNVNLNTSTLGLGASSGDVKLSSKNGDLTIASVDIDSRSLLGAGGDVEIKADGGSVAIGAGTIDTSSGGAAGSINVSTTKGDASIDMHLVSLNAEGSASGSGGSIFIISGSDGASAVDSDGVQVGNINAGSNASGSADIHVSSSLGDVKTGEITTNGGAITLSAGGNLSVVSVNGSSANGTGASVQIASNTRYSADDSAPTQNLLIGTIGTENSVGSISVNGLRGGAMDISNQGSGGVTAGSLIVISQTSSGGGIFIQAPGLVTLAGQNYAVDAGTSGAGGRISVSSETGIAMPAQVTITAKGGDGDGGAVALGSPQITLGGELTIISSGQGLFGASGLVGINASVVSGSSIDITNEGGGILPVTLAGDFQTSSITVRATGGNTFGHSGGTIIFRPTSDIHGTVFFDASGSIAGGGGNIEISSNGDLNVTASQFNIKAESGAVGGYGGTVVLNAGGDLNLDTSALSVAPRGTNGNGGNLFINTGLDPSRPSGDFSATGTINVDGVGFGRGGIVSITANGTNSAASNLDVGTGAFSISARGGQSGGGGGSIFISVSGNLNVNAAALNVNAGLGDADGGNLSLAAGVDRFGAVANGTLSLTGSLAADASGSGNGGSLNLTANKLVFGGSGANVSLSAKANGGNGGTIVVQALGSDADLIVDSSVNLDARGGFDSESPGDGGSITLSASRNLSLLGANINASSMGSSGDGGTITLEAGVGQVGSLALSGDVLADAHGSGRAGNINLSYRSSSSLSIGQLDGNGNPGSGRLSASASSGEGGTLTVTNFISADTVLNVNQSILLNGSSLEKIGNIQLNADGRNVNVSGAGSVVGAFEAQSVSFAVNVSGAASIIGIKQVSATVGDIDIVASASDSRIYFVDGAGIDAGQGQIRIGARRIDFLGDSLISMSAAGIMKIDSGATTNSLSMFFTAGANNIFNIDQGSSQRPGVVLLGPSGNGGLSLASSNPQSGGSNLEFTGATVSITAGSGGIEIGPGIDLHSTGFDPTEEIGLEIAALNGDIVLNGRIDARQLNVSTLGSGSITFGADITAPTIEIAAGGLGMVNQAGGVLGLGTIFLSSQSGDIGSTEKHIVLNVLEVRISSGGSVYLDNQSTCDLKTTEVSGQLVFNVEGDVAMESAITAGNLLLSATGNIGLFNTIDGINGVTLSATESGSIISVGSGGILRSSNGSIQINGGNLQVDGRVEAVANAMRIDVISATTLNLSGSSGVITLAGGGSNLLNIVAGDSVSFRNSFTLNAGSSGTVQISTTNLSATSKVELSGASPISLNIDGGSQLKIATSILSLPAGSTVNLSRSSGIAMLAQSMAGGGLPLVVQLGAGTTVPINTAGGSVEFRAGIGSPLAFQNTGAGRSTLAVNGGQLITESSGADTSLSNVNIQSAANITVNVHGATLNLNGDINSSNAGGLIVLRDPDGMTISGTASIGFIQGASGNILVQAIGAANDLIFSGTQTFNAGSSGSVTFGSERSIIFAAGARGIVNSGSPVSIVSPNVVFGAGSQVQASGASTISLTGGSSTGVNVQLPAGSSSTISSNGGQINIQAATGNSITFQSSGPGGNANLLLLGAPVTVSTENANVNVQSGVVIQTDHNLSILTPGGSLVNNGQIQTPNSTTTIESAFNLLVDQNVSAQSLIIRTTANNSNITLAADVNVVGSLTVSAHGSGDIIYKSGLLTAGSITITSESGKIGTSNKAIRISTPELSVSTKGAAYVSANGSVRVDSYKAGGGFHLIAGGNIFLGAANASSIAINSSGEFNAGANGVVSIIGSGSGSSISFAKGIDFSVNGKSKLLLQADRIDIGNAANISGQSDINIVTAFLNNNGDLSSSAKQGTISIKALGSNDLHLSGRLSDPISITGRNVTILSATSKSIFFDSTYKFDVGDNGKVTISGQGAGSSIVLASGISVITKSGTDLILNAPSLTMGNGASLKSAGDLTLSTTVSGTNYSLQGDNIRLNGNVSASNLAIKAGSSGDIIQASGALITATNLTLYSGNGDIGTANAPINIDAGTLTVETGGHGRVNIQEANALTLNDSQSGGAFSLKAGGNLTVNSVKTKEGSITLVGKGSIRVEKESMVRANEGNLTIQNLDTKNGTIVIGKNVNLEAYTNDGRTGLGQVRVVIGSVPSKLVEGRTPANVKISERYGGHVYFGTNGIVAEGKNNQLNAWGSDIIFSTGSLSASAIKLEGGITIIADPPVANPTVAEIPAVAGSTAAGIQFNLTPYTTMASLPISSISGIGTSAKTTVGEDEDRSLFVDQSSILKPIAFISPVSSEMNAVQKAVGKDVDCYMSQAQFQKDSSDRLCLHSGEIIINARKDRHILLPDAKVQVMAGGTAMIRKTAGALEIYNLCETGWGSLRVDFEQGESVVVGSGQRLLLKAGDGSHDRMPVRQEKHHRLSDGRKFSVAEYPLMELMQQSKTLKLVLLKDGVSESKLAAKLMKMAACLSIVTASHGPYRK